MPKPTYKELEQRVSDLEKFIAAFRHADEKTKASISFLDAVIDMSPISMWVSGKDGTVIRTNQSLRKTIRLSDDKIIGEYNVFKDRNIENAGVMPKVRAVFERYETARFSIIWKAGLVENVDFADARDMHIDVSMFPILNNHGELENVVCQWVDITDLRQAERELKDAILRQDEAIKASNVGLWDWDLETNKVYYSKEWKQQLGYDEHEIGDDFEEWKKRIHPDDLKPTLEKVNQSITMANDDHKAEFRMQHRDGSYRWILTQASIIRDGTGHSARMLGSHIDITERKRTENELRKNENLLQRVFDILPIGLWFADQNGKLIKGNPAGIRIWGAEPHVGPEEYGVFKARRLPSREELSPDDWALAHTIRDGIIVKDELLEIDAFDGTKKTILNYTAPVLDENDNVEAAVIVNLDISDRVKAEQAALQSKAQLRTLVDTIPDLIWLKDEDGIYLSCNPTFERFFGAAESEIVGKSDYDFVDKEIADFFREHDQKAAAAGGPSINEEWLTFKANGYYGLFETIKTPMYDSDGNLVGVLGIARDITKRHNAEKEKIMIEGQLKQSQKMESIGSLAGGIAHDFNNILASIIGFTELALDETQKGTDLEDNLQEVYLAGKRAKDLVKQILAFARQSDEKMSPIQPCVIAKEVFKFIRSTIPTTIELRQDIESDSLIMGNATQVHQVLMNLCTNAAHAMEDSGGVLKISLKNVFFDKKDLLFGMRRGDYIVIEVSDTGVGIAPEIIKSIFDPYFTTKDPGEGTGMGLAVVHGIVESYGGKIFVDSQLGKGTTFSIYLPISRQRSALHEYVSEQLPSGTERILFVDDEAPLAKMGSQILEHLGYSITTRTSSIEALELFQAKPNDFDLIVTDMTMPNLTGDKLAIELMKIREDIPVILCTGYSKKMSDETASEIGIKAFAYKPMVKADLAKTVRKVLDEAKGSAQG